MVLVKRDQPVITGRPNWYELVRDRPQVQLISVQIPATWSLVGGCLLCAYLAAPRELEQGTSLGGSVRATGAHPQASGSHPLLQAPLAPVLGSSFLGLTLFWKIVSFAASVPH